MRGMGSTLVAGCFRPDGVLLVSNVGDSRLYRLRGDTLLSASPGITAYCGRSATRA
jgi:serine/threonine protein phosphatase PrpC